MREKLTAVGIDPIGETPAKFAAKLGAEVVPWRPIVRKMGLQQE